MLSNEAFSLLSELLLDTSGEQCIDIFSDELSAAKELESEGLIYLEEYLTTKSDDFGQIVAAATVFFINPIDDRVFELYKKALNTEKNNNDSADYATLHLNEDYYWILRNNLSYLTDVPELQDLYDNLCSQEKL